MTIDETPGSTQHPRGWQERAVLRDSVPPALLGLFLAVWTLLALSPRYRADWLLENVLVVLAVPVLVATYRWLRFSNLAYGALFVFLVLHEIGAHYTYAEVPYDAWSKVWLGISIDQVLGFPRNEYDRFVHFIYGVLLTPMVFELIDARARPQGAWRWVLPVTFLMATSVLFELVEWFAAVHFGGDLGVAYLGTQGDVWDAQSDMGLASLGSMMAVLALRLGRAAWCPEPGRPP